MVGRQSWIVFGLLLGCQVLPTLAWIDIGMFTDSKETTPQFPHWPRIPTSDAPNDPPGTTRPPRVRRTTTTESATTQTTGDPRFWPIITSETPEITTTQTTVPAEDTSLEISTEYSSTVIQDASTETDPVGILNQAPVVFKKLDTLPNGMKISDLNQTFDVYNGIDDFSRVVANNATVYVLNSVQSRKNETVFDPYTIGQVLGYIYETSEYGDSGPPGGFTIIHAGGRIPIKTSNTSNQISTKKRRGALLFKKKQAENDYWKTIWEHP